MIYLQGFKMVSLQIGVKRQMKYRI
jgi:hypothetical protein